MPDNLAEIPEGKRILLDGLVARLSSVPGMAAIAPGGSDASGTQTETSDMDIGLYYHEDRPFSIADIRRIAEEVSAGSRSPFR